jgi:hypothetical protein
MEAVEGLEDLGHFQESKGGFDLDFGEDSVMTGR